MTDELRTPPPPMFREEQAERRTRRAYARPELKEFGSVKELTRGVSGPNKDAGRRRK